jgi:hypothetical protein
MKALVTGLSASKYYSPKYELTVGVNDCPFPVDHLIICDHPRIFEQARMDFIKEHSGWLFTHIRDWSRVRQAEMIRLSDKRSDVSMPLFTRFIVVQLKYTLPGLILSGIII